MKVIGMQQNEKMLEKFKKKSDIHWARKLWHIFGVMIIFLIFQYMPLEVSKVLVVFGWLILISLDTLRKSYPRLNKILIDLFHPFMRQYEVENFAGTTFLISGVAVLILFFSEKIASLSLLFLAFADPIASFFGIKYGKDKIYGDKTFQGFFAAVVVCTVITFAYLNFYGYPSIRVLICSVLAGLLGAVAELIPLGKLDDNLTLPIISGLGLTALFYLFGFL